MIAGKNPFAVRTTRFLGRRALFRPDLPAAAGAGAFTGIVVYEYTPSPSGALPAGTEAGVAQPPPAPLPEAVPAAPGAGFVWIGGAWVWEDRWAWEGGRWARPPHRGAVWVVHRHSAGGGAGMFIRGGWP